MRRLISVLTVLSLLFCLTGCSKLKNVPDRLLEYGKNIICTVLNAGCRTIRKIFPEDASFNNYTGFRDWYRFPLKYPYHFLMTDILTKGTLEKYNGGDIRDPMKSSETIDGCTNIIQLYWNDQYAVFDREDQKYGILTFQNGSCHVFSTAEERNVFLKEHYPLPEKEMKMHSPEYYYSLLKKQ